VRQRQAAANSRVAPTGMKRMDCLAFPWVSLARSTSLNVSDLGCAPEVPAGIAARTKPTPPTLGRRRTIVRWIWRFLGLGQEERMTRGVGAAASNPTVTA